MAFPINALIESSKHIVAAFAAQAAGLDQLADGSVGLERSYYLQKAVSVRSLAQNEEIRLRGLQKMIVV